MGVVGVGVVDGVRDADNRYENVSCLVLLRLSVESKETVVERGDGQRQCRVVRVVVSDGLKVGLFVSVSCRGQRRGRCRGQFACQGAKRLSC